LFYFDLKFKKAGKKVKKGPKDFSKNFSKFFANSSQQNFKSRGSSGFLAPPLPHPPPSSLTFPPLCFKDLPEGLGFLAWNGIVTLWTSTPAKGGVCGGAVYFFLWVKKHKDWAGIYWCEFWLNLDSYPFTFDPPHSSQLLHHCLMKDRNRDKNRVRCIGKNRWHGGGKLSSSGFDVRVLQI